MAQFRFVMRSGPTVGQPFPVEGDEITIGRDTNNKLSINDSEVSRKHARLVRQGEGYLLEDFGSTNGTFVNGQRLSGSIGLKAGDLVALGENIALVYEAQYDPDATMLSSAKHAKAEKPAPVPASAPVYSGHVPEGPVPVQAEPAIAVPAKKSRSTTLIIVIVALILFCILAVAIFLFFAPTSFWCSLPLINWGQGACP